MKKALIALFIAGLGISPLHVAFAQDLSTQKVPLDPGVRMGKLKNGITYYIRKNAEPKNRAELRLAVKAGSVLETDAQQGLAHFMEHMNFNGTTNFPKNELVNFLQKTGVRFGADLNAYTGFDETVYMLPIPTDSAGLLDKGIQVLEDWAHGALLDPSEIEKERGVVLEESRMGRGAQQRMRDKFLKVILNNSRYAERLPIGKDSILKSFKPETIKAFYQDWYRPDLISVIAVGDFDVDKVEAIIKQKFSSIPSPANAKKRTKYAIPLDGSTKVAIVTDPEYPQNLIQLIYKQPNQKVKSLKDVRDNFAQGLYNSMMGQRMQELTQKANPPFLYGDSQYGDFLGDLDSYTSIALAKDAPSMKTALTALLEENARVQKFGFTQPELDRAKKDFYTAIEQYYKERDKTKSSEHVQEYLDHFLHDKPYMSAEAYFEFVKKHLDGVSLAEVNGLAKKYITDKNRAVVVMGPEKSKDDLPKEAEIRKLLVEAGKDVTAYVDDVVDSPLLPAEPKPGKVAGEKTLEKLGVTELTFSNGVKVLLKPTDFKNDEILIKATGKGGYSLFPDERETGMFSSYLIQSGGVGPYNQTQLQKFLAGKTASAGPYVSELTEGIGGSTSPKDLETTLQLIYAYFTAPRKDADVVTGILANQKAYLENIQKTLTPEKVYSDSLNAVLTSNNPKRKPLKPESIDKVSLDRAVEMYNDRFADASDFVFTFVGAFKPEEIKPLLEKYIGGLPSTDRDDTFKHPDIFPPKGTIEKTIYKGLEPKSRVTLISSGEYEYNPENNIQIEALQEVLQIKLIEALREEESGVYGVSVSESTDKFPTGHYRFNIGFGCAPENVDKLVKRAREEVDKVKQNGADPKDIEKFVAETQRKTETALKTNNFWLDYLDDNTFLGDDLDEIFLQDKLLKSITVASTKAAAEKYFNNDNFIKVVLMPEKK
ncbi:M16 family metallopeptidase [Dyadobacter fanqingshengii]|uniref:Insulinase family protein n=1 Tax=Dyadobacter fanqingshengii TaxID=2906443 RepID=A0A9X1P623_9BACT|nr:insulinase family protein [Dyadobacter fanqingshengii]MCF0039406.1 insulinase family protein [Dyadobacter fanqingshengii]USJ33781.1 insulinase family protein [Dyadobacter fanqingshengii]